jgi:hypothetical protein
LFIISNWTPYCSTPHTIGGAHDPTASSTSRPSSSSKPLSFKRPSLLPPPLVWLRPCPPPPVAPVVPPLSSRTAIPSPSTNPNPNLDNGAAPPLPALIRCPTRYWRPRHCLAPALPPANLRRTPESVSPIRLRPWTAVVTCSRYGAAVAWKIYNNNNQVFYSQASWGRLEMKPHE